MIHEHEMQDLTELSLGDGLSVNPFRDDIYSAHFQLPGIPQIHQKELNRCLEVIRLAGLANRISEFRAHGELIFLSSPLAGYGKSHLIGRLSKELSPAVIPLEFSFGSLVSWREMLASTVQNLNLLQRDSKNENGLLDDLAACFLSNFILAAVTQGVIQENDCPVPWLTLQGDYKAGFAQSARPRVLAWLKKRLPLLRSSVTMAKAQTARFSRDSTAFWAEFFLKHMGKDENRFKSLKNLSETKARERFLHLLQIATKDHPMLIIADHLDGCHGSQTVGMEIATALISITENVPNSVIIFSANDDLWNSVFQDKLPSALLDRLNRERIELTPIELDAAKELLVTRLCASGLGPQQSQKFAMSVSEYGEWTPKDQLYPRQVLRHAREVWNKRYQEFAKAPEAAMLQESPPGNPFYVDPVTRAVIQSPSMVPLPSTGIRETVDPVTRYFDQLEKFYGKRADKLVINFPALESLVKTVGQNHEPMNQSESIIESGGGSCLHWDLPHHSVWICFQPDTAIHYYQKILQKMLEESEGRSGKVVTFSHFSSPFSKESLTTNGIDSNDLNRYFDFLQLNNYELVQIYSATQLLKET